MARAAVARARVVVTAEQVEAFALGAITLAELGEGLGCHTRTAAAALRRAGYRPENRLARPRRPRPPHLELSPEERAERNNEIVRAVFLGEPYQEIGRRYDVTKQRVAAIVADFRRRVGLDAVPGLTASPCVACGTIIAARYLVGPQYCQACWYRLATEG